MKVVSVIAKALMASIYLLYGLNFFLHFFHASLPSGKAGDFEGGLIRSGYFFEYMKGMQIAAGLFLFINRYVPLILVIMFPVSMNIFLFHIFLLARGIVVATILISANTFLLYAYRKYYIGLLIPVAKI
jgi:putative oxidoreductase